MLTIGSTGFVFFCNMVGRIHYSVRSKSATWEISIWRQNHSYLELARHKGLVEEILPLATMKTVVGVQRGNPKQVRDLNDLLREDVRVVLANPDQAAVGRAVRDALQKTGDWAALRECVNRRGVFKPTVGEVANDIKLGSIDAGILWDAVATQYPANRNPRDPAVGRQHREHQHWRPE